VKRGDFLQFCTFFILALVQIASCYALEINSKYVHEGPFIDGKREKLWERSKALEVVDPLTEKKVLLQSLFDDEYIYFKVTYPDKSEDREHKLLVWKEKLKMYKTGIKREDTFLFKWSLQGDKVDLSLEADYPYVADVWYWKAHRTDPIGYADDKRHVYSPNKSFGSKKLISKGGKVFYLSRPGDDGRPAYEILTYDKHVEQTMPRYRQQTPTGSRGDIRAKGTWENGVWTVELRRKLRTGNQDDVIFDTKKTYFFGISVNEIAARDPDYEYDNPFHGVGKISKLIELKFIK